MQALLQTCQLPSHQAWALTPTSPTRHVYLTIPVSSSCPGLMASAAPQCSMHVSKWQHSSCCRSHEAGEKLCCGSESRISSCAVPECSPLLSEGLHLALQVVGFYGTKSVSYQEALAAIFIEGWIFIAISILGIRQKLIALLPRYSTRTSPCRWPACEGQRGGCAEPNLTNASVKVAEQPCVVTCNVRVKTAAGLCCRSRRVYSTACRDVFA